MTWRLRCRSCGFVGEEGRYYPFCPRCGGAMEFDGEPPRYGRLLGEGNTPLVLRSTRVGHVKFKLEYVNPTGSFKDRGASYSLQLAKDLGYTCVVEDSSGNAGISTAAYAAYLGMRARIIVPATAAPGKIQVIRALGAELITAPTRAEAASMAEAMVSECFYVSHSRSAAFLEGMKSVGLELSQDKEVRGIVVPSASFGLLLGIYYGYHGSPPPIYAAQGVDNPSLAAFVEPTAVGKGSSSRLADGLVLPRAPRAEEAAKAVRSTKGGLILVSDQEIVDAMGELWRMGLMAEPTSAAAFAALSLLAEQGVDVSNYVAVLTGSGLKYAAQLAEIMRG